MKISVISKLLLTFVSTVLFYNLANEVVINAKTNEDTFVYLPLIFKTEPPLIIADFDSCNNYNNLGGEMGGAYKLPDRLNESFIPESGRGCVAKLDYEIVNWAAFWMKLEGADFSPYTTLAFDIKVDPGDPHPGSSLYEKFKIELKRLCTDQGGTTVCQEVSILGHEPGTTASWETRGVCLADFYATGDPKESELTAWTDMEELVFTFEKFQSGSHGIVYLDNVALIQELPSSDGCPPVTN